MSKNYAYTNMYERNTMNQSNDRILELSIKDSSLPVSSTGLIDKRLFSKGNKLHAVQDAGLWHLKYEEGKIPQALNQKFTTFNMLLKVVKNYFDNRNIEIKEIVQTNAATG